MLWSEERLCEFLIRALWRNFFQLSARTPKSAARTNTSCSRDANSDTVDVADLSCDVGLIVKDFSCRYIRFVVPSTNTEVPPTKQPRTVVDALMSASNKKEQLFNDVKKGG